jgi:pimeloyl-ACP methyl ester carboxylesterase
MRRSIALGAAIAALALPASATAAPCPDLDGWDCGKVTVPISRSDPSLGTTTATYAFRPHDDQSRPAEGTTLVSDSPGGSTFPPAGFLAFSALGDDLLKTHDVIAVDPRGTGAQALDCPAYQHGTSPFAQAIPECAAQLGRARDYYTYGDLADDLDAVRAALKVDKVDLYATGHATAVMEAYAIRHPDHVRSAVLDSAMQINPWNDEDIANALHVAGNVCRRSPLCSAQIRDPEGELAWLAKRLRERPLTGIGYDGDGKPHRVTLDEAKLVYVLMFDKSGAVRTPAELPAAARALRNGDPVPLLRLAAELDGPLPWEPSDNGEPSDFSTAGLNAAFCAQWPFGFDKAAPLATRFAQFRAASAALPRDFFAPFSLQAGLAVTPDQCIYWPPPARTNPILPPGANYPSVPVLVIAGDINTDHAPTLAAEVAARFPRGRFVPIPQAGQSAAGWSRCAQRIIHAFVATFATGDTSCKPDEMAAVPGVGAFPRSVRDYAPALPDAGDRSTPLDRKLAAAAVHTALDAIYTQFNHASGDGGRGLRGGSYDVEFGDDGATFTFHGARLVEDVSVGGTFFFGFSAENQARLTFKGCGVSGVLETTGSVFDVMSPRMAVTGTIGGRRVALQVPIH